MKKIITLLLFLSSIGLSRLDAQNLYNTYWASYDTSGTLISYFYIGTDTVFFSQDNINYTAFSIVKINGSQITIYDLPFATSCQVSDTGIYIFSLQNDTLKFTLISDPCIGRSNGATNNNHVRMYVGIQRINALTLMKVYPNPFNDFTTIKLDKVYPRVDIQIHDITGTLVFSREISNSQEIEIHRQNLNSGVYFMMVNIDGESTVKKLIIE